MSEDKASVEASAHRVLLGATSFTFSVLCLWRASGRPDDPESDIWRILVNAFAKLRDRGISAAKYERR